MDDTLRYPIGRFAPPAAYTAESRAAAIASIAALPSAVRAAVRGMGDLQLDTPYRPEGWTIRQVVHHLADSHANASIRARWALTEDNPVIKPYDENAWAALADAATGPIEPSLHILDGVHERWVALLRSLPPERLATPWRHPEREGTLTLDFLCAMYAWHGEHHVEQIRRVRFA